jgi:uncharacterized protein YjiS (DUF1127 family)
MSIFQRIAHAPVTIGFDPIASIIGMLRTVWLWNERYMQRRALAELDRRLLLDAGIDADQREAELAKPFWRG